MSDRREVIVLDPAVATPELDCFNLIARLSPLPASYHLPAMWGLASVTAGSLARPPAAIVVLGSRASVYDPLAWQGELSGWLWQQMQAGVPILGLCYGHQLLAHLFGASVGLNASREKLTGLRTVCFNKDARLGFTGGETGALVVSHYDVVTSLPAGMRVFAHSPLVAYEAFAHENLPVWSLQAHPEATPAFCRNAGICLDSSLKEEAAFGFGWQVVSRFLAFAAGYAPQKPSL